jgi:hypothetical protein
MVTYQLFELNRAKIIDHLMLCIPMHRPDAPIICDEGESHFTSFAKQAAAFFKMSRSARSLITSRRSFSTSS